MTFSILWLLFACLTVVGAVGYNIAVKIAGETINAFVFTALLTLTALIGHLACLGIYKFLNTEETLVISKQGFWMAVLAGLSVVTIDLAYFYALKHGSLTVTSAFWTIGGLSVTAIVSYFIFKDVLNIEKLIGIALGFIGLFLLVK